MAGGRSRLMASGQRLPPAATQRCAVLPFSVAKATGVAALPVPRGGVVVPVARAQQAVPLTAHLDFNAGEVQFRTMYKEPPEFYIQKHFPWRGMNKAREVPQEPGPMEK